MADKWISFDCYGTLVDWKAAMIHSMEIVAAGKGEAMLRHHRRIEGEIERGPYIPYRQVLAESLRRMAEAEGLTLPPNGEHILSTTLPFWPLFRDTGPALTRLRDDGWRLCILSNVDRDLIQGTLRQMPVMIDLVITAEDVRSYKPAPGHLERFLARSGAARDRWVHAAVNFEYDLVPAQRHGAACVWINRGQEPKDDTGFLLAELADLSRLPDRLKARFG
jgi:2-haloacid dehalogenase